MIPPSSRKSSSPDVPGTAARNALVLAHLGLAHFAVRQWQARHGSDPTRFLGGIGDALAIARLALFAAVTTWDPARASFSTHAVWQIRLALARAVWHARKEWPNRRLPERLGPGALARPDPGFLERQQAEDTEDCCARVRHALGRLPPRERHLLWRTLAEGQSLATAAAEIGLSASRAGWLRRRAAETLQADEQLSEGNRRPTAPPAHVRVLVTECPAGHPMSPSNVARYGGRRICRRCRRRLARERYHRLAGHTQEALPS